MYRKRFRLLVAAAVCTTLALVNTQPPAAAEEPQTVTVHVRADVLLRSVFHGPAAGTLRFRQRGHGGRSWWKIWTILSLHLYFSGVRPTVTASRGRHAVGEPLAAGGVVNKKTGPMRGLVLAPAGPGFRHMRWSLPRASRRCTPAGSNSRRGRTGLRAGAWMRNTAAVFIVVTAEFRVTN